jgi:diadenosine tetraphosphate (Ap4A) HIT family hydrolase
MVDDACCAVSARPTPNFGRRRVWQDDLWRLSVVLHGAVVGLAHLESHRHIPFLPDLDGPEAASLGAVLPRVCATMRTATAADKVYVYVEATDDPWQRRSKINGIRQVS